MATNNERLKLLESGEARGILRPEHKAELARLRAAGGGGAAKAKTSAQDQKALTEGSDRAAAAGQSLRLYDNVTPALERFDPGPVKGSIYGMVMPNDGGGFWDGLGAVVGTPIRALLPQQDKDDYQRIDAARAERVALRQKEQKGPQTDKDATLYGKADIGANKSLSTNRKIVRDNKTESHLTQVRALLQSKWVGRYGSLSQASPNGTTFEQALRFAEKDFLQSKARRSAPPSTRRAAAGWSVQEVK